MGKAWWIVIILIIINIVLLISKPIIFDKRCESLYDKYELDYFDYIKCKYNCPIEKVELKNGSEIDGLSYDCYTICMAQFSQEVSNYNINIGKAKCKLMNYSSMHDEFYKCDKDNHYGLYEPYSFKVCVLDLSEKYSFDL